MFARRFALPAQLAHKNTATICAPGTGSSLSPDRLRYYKYSHAAIMNLQVYSSSFRVKLPIRFSTSPSSHSSVADPNRTHVQHSLPPYNAAMASIHLLPWTRTRRQSRRSFSSLFMLTAANIWLSCLLIRLRSLAFSESHPSRAP
jgi:hypothetical protein